MEVRDLHKIFYGFAVASCLLLLVNQHPAMFIGVVSFWLLSISAGVLVFIARREAELGIENDWWSPAIKDALRMPLRRIAAEEVLKALASIELVGRRLRDGLRSSEESALNPEAQRQFTAWLDSANRDLAQARGKLDDLMGAASPERSNPSPLAAAPDRSGEVVGP